MKWSEVNCGEWTHMPFDENERAIKGFALTSFGVDLENIPESFFEQCRCYSSQGKQYDNYIEEKVFVSDIIGTSYDMYGNIPWIETYQKLKRARNYISEGRVSKNKYFWLLKRPTELQKPPVKLSKNFDGCFVDGNGNHRVTIYKMMYFAELSKIFFPPKADLSAYLKSLDDCEHIKRKYWLYALVRKEK